MNQTPHTTPYLLGLDLGAASIGWAALKIAEGKPAGILAAGSRIFPAGVEGDIEKGKDESRNLKRRQARQQRRQIWRRARRKRKIFRLLQNHGLLPGPSIGSGEDIQTIVQKLDQSIAVKYLNGASTQKAALAHVLPYKLRADALDRKLDLHELGRALYHLAQRRGFASNRKQSKKKEDIGQVKQGIAELDEQIRTSNSRTLGEYFAKIDPEQERIRQRWTARRMFIDEFEKIWQAQAQHWPETLTEAFRDELYHAIFYQRPLAIQSFLVGNCDYEPDRKRAPMAIWAAQRFRLLQKVNDLEAISTETGEMRPLSEQERQALIDLLEREGTQSFAKIRKHLGLGKEWTFNFERGGEKNLIGNRTSASLSKVFGDAWFEFSEAKKNQIVDDIRSIEKEETLLKRAAAWKLSEQQAEELANVDLEDSYCSLSRQALAKVLPELEKGQRYGAVIAELYPRPASAAMDLLPALQSRSAQIPSGLRNIRNPSVNRTLSELRKVVNALIRTYGKPVKIHIELARDLRNSRPQREKIAKTISDNRRAREEGAARVLSEFQGIANPSSDQIRHVKRQDIEKVLLAEECGWQCPFTGKAISMNALLGPSPQFDVEHIIPFSRSLDDSFANKTLCEHNENRNFKRNRTPFEAYAGDPTRWEQILQRVKAFKGTKAFAKFKRFQATPEEVKETFENFDNRQLNDTRYASRLAADYLGLLYGGRNDASGKKRIQTGNGQITAYLRSGWSLNNLLNADGIKSRDDHRHHAVDALVIALTDAQTVAGLSRAAEQSPIFGRPPSTLPPPWPGFVDEARNVIENIVVSHRPQRRVQGPLHEETLYSNPKVKLDENKTAKTVVHIRKPVTALTKNEIEEIVDPVIRERVKAKLAEIGGDPKKLETKDGANWPTLPTKDGRQIPIKRVRIAKNTSTQKIGGGKRERNIISGNNHHIEIFATTGKKNMPKWEGVVVSLLEAVNRQRQKTEVVQKNHGNDAEFIFSLSAGDTIETESPKKLWVIRGISTLKQGDNLYPRIDAVEIRDSRLKKEIPTKDRLTILLEPLRKSKCRKVSVDPIGRVFPTDPTKSMRD